jgi:ABC-type transport system substrate-binding protein
MLLSACGDTSETTTTTTAATTATTTAKTTTTTTSVTTAPTTTTAADVPIYGGTLTAVKKTDAAAGYDPYRYGAGTQHVVDSVVLEGLAIGDWARGPGGTNEFLFEHFKIDPGSTVGILAESWEVSPDGYSEITFHLRRGVYFHDKAPANGREVTAGDVKYCWDRRLGTGSGFTQKTPYNWQDGLKFITEVEVKDKYTVVFKANGFSFNALVELLVGYEHGIYPREVIETYGNMDNWKNVIGFGPYTLEDYVEGSSITMKKNPNYFRYDPLHPQNKLPYIDTYRILFITDDATRMTAIRTGQADYTLYDFVQWRDREALEKTMSTLPDFWRLRYGTSVAIKMNMGPDDVPLGDLNVRRALYMAIDFEGIKKIKGGENPETYGSGLNSPSGPDLYTPFNELPAVCQDFLTYQPTKAKQMLADAGFPNGMNLSLTIASNNSYMDVYELVAGYWAAIGVTLKFDTVTSTVFSTKERVDDYQMITTLPGTVGYNPVITYAIHGVGTNEQRNPDTVAEEWWDRATMIVNEVERNKEFKALNVYMVENVYFIVPNVLEAKYLTTQPWIGGYHGEIMLRKHDVSSTIPYLWVIPGLK